MPIRAVLNFAKAAPWPNAWYPRGQERLRRSLEDTGWTGKFLAYQDEGQLSCPSHLMVPYGFKIAAFNAALRQNCTSVLWCDSSVWAIKNLDPIFEHIEKYGHILFHSGFNCAQWTNDRALTTLGVTRDEAEKMPMYMALCMGLDLSQTVPQNFIRQLYHYAFINSSDIFRGSWTNDLKTESADLRCLGHRHDQSIGSLLAARLGLGLTVGNETFFDYFHGKKLYDYGGVNDMSGVRDSVVLLAQGMMS